MQKRALGRSGISVAPLVFGGNVFGWTADRPTSFALLDRFAEQGFNAIDTADVYSAWAPGNSGGESETILGEWLRRRGRRDDLVIMTKVGSWQKHKGLKVSTITAAVEDSLRRLQTDYIDVYFAHIDDTSVPLAETMGAFSRLIQAGKIRAAGASNYKVQRLSEALDTAASNGLARYEVLQPNYNLYDRSDFESGLAKAASDNEVGVVCYFGLAAGFLTGKYRSEEDVKGKSRAGMVKGYLNERGYRILKALDEISAGLSATQAQVALAWLMARPGVTAPIASATSLHQLDDALGAARLDLSSEAIAKLDEASAY
ncbi:MAG TPA: aldo/keto reductase [Bryobacteraceae bacterium]|nr:aldo/keto reductase [Bryobacteraceae bacterium]